MSSDRSRIYTHHLHPDTWRKGGVKLERCICRSIHPSCVYTNPILDQTDLHWSAMPISWGDPGGMSEGEVRPCERPQPCRRMLLEMTTKKPEHETGERVSGTCAMTSIDFKHTPELAFQKRSVWSTVPPPVQSRLGFQGHQASAFTAAWCSRKVACGTAPDSCDVADAGQMATQLSLAPEARKRLSGDHARPQTS